MKIEYNSEINAFLSATLDVQERLLNTETRHETKQLHWIKCKKKIYRFFSFRADKVCLSPISALSKEKTIFSLKWLLQTYQWVKLLDNGFSILVDIQL